MVEEALSGAGSPHSEGWTLRLGKLPAVVIMVLVAIGLFGVLTAANLNGSSLSLLGTTGGTDHGVLIGKARSIRSDEFAIASPQSVGNARRGMPTSPQVGLNQLYIPAVGEFAPAAHWITFFRPAQWGWFILPISRAFAFQWWMPLALCLVGITWLLSVLGAQRGVAIALAVVGTAAPVVVWWSNGPALVLGLATLAGAALLKSATSGQFLHLLGWSLVAAFWSVAFALILYPPWLLSVGLIIAAAVIGYLIDLRVPWRRAAATLGITGMAALVVLAFWYEGSRAAITAMSQTIYPGHRLEPSGTARASWLFSAPSYLWATYTHHATIAHPANVSETSSPWLPAPLIIVLAAATIWFGRRTHSDGPAATDRYEVPRFWSATLVSSAMALLLAWALVPGIDFVGQLTLLDRAQGKRMNVALGLGALVLLGLASTTLRRRLTRPWLMAVGAAVIASALLAAWAGGTLPWVAHSAPPAGGVFLSGLFLAGMWALVVGKRPGVGAWLLAAFAVASTVGVNPLYQGIGPLDHDPVVRLVRVVAASGDHVAALGPTKLSALAASTGAEVVSGLTYYPDQALWQSLDPGQERIWNNYINYTWVYDPTAQPVRITGSSGSSRTLQINLCDSRVVLLHVKWVIAAAPVAAACLTLDSTAPDGSSGTIYFYRDLNS